jgi:MoxR-like ATPase
MSDTLAAPAEDSYVQQVVRWAEDSYQPKEVASSPIDTVEDLLELSESVQMSRVYLAERYRAVHPQPAELPADHVDRVVKHAKFLREVGKISTKDWERAGIDPESEEIDGRKVAEVLNTQDPGYVSSLTRPDWDEHFPTNRVKSTQGSEEPVSVEQALQEWQEFKSQFPEDMQVELESLYQSSQQLDAAGETESLFKDFSTRKEANYGVLVAASSVRALEKMSQKMKFRAQKMRRSIPEGISSQAVLLEAEELERQAKHFEARAAELYVSVETDEEGNVKATHENPDVKKELARRSRLDDRRQLRHGLLKTPDMEKVIDDFLPQATAGKPVLFVGETGGAKTAAAEQLASEVLTQLGKDPKAYEFISGYGQLNSYQLMGKDTIRTDDEGRTFTEYAYGAVTRAMKEGVPVIIDEANAADPNDIQKRFNKIMQLKPGDTFQIQEDGGERVVVQPGFCLIMTANEKSGRYKSVNEMSADFKNRFGANIARIGYPDADILPGNVPPTLMRLAQANIMDRYGQMPKDNPALDVTEVSEFVAACHRLQRLFTIPLENLNEAERDTLDTSMRRNTGSGQTALKSETISPRMMSEILTDLVAGGRSGVRLDTILDRYVQGVTDASDRAIIKMILDNRKISTT